MGDPEAKQHIPDLPYWFDQLGSFDKQHIIKHFEGRLVPYIISKELEGITLPILLDRNNVNVIDLLHIDTEGYDWNILSQLDLEKFTPKFIMFEHNHLSSDALKNAFDFLSDQYFLFKSGIDVLAVNRDLPAAFLTEFLNSNWNKSVDNCGLTTSIIYDHYRLKGGMGNQMFQYAFGLQVAKQLNTALQLDLSALLDRSKKDIVHRNYDLDIFNVKPDFVVNPILLQTLYTLKSSSISRFVRNRTSSGKHYVKEKHFHVVEELIHQPQDDAIYDGWWQSEKYFQSVADQIRQEFTFKKAILPNSLSLLQNIQQSNSICLNVRRTDFLKSNALNTTNLDYFLRGVDYIVERIDKPAFFIFSDDIDWCRQNINLKHPTTIVTHDLKGEKFGNYLQLMKACKHFIIPNSSFAWWLFGSTNTRKR